MTRVLCLHGLAGTGATMWPIVAACIDADFTTLAPTLPGHGTDPADLVGITWDEWLDAARSWEADVVVGQSLGANLAMQLAVEKRCRALVCINPVAPDPDALEGLEWRKGRGQPLSLPARETAASPGVNRNLRLNLRCFQQDPQTIVRIRSLG